MLQRADKAASSGGWFFLQAASSGGWFLLQAASSGGWFLLQAASSGGGFYFRRLLQEEVFLLQAASWGCFFRWLLQAACRWKRSCARSLASGLSREARTGDAAAPVVWWTYASGRGVPERVRRPRERSGPGATTLTVVGEGLTGHKREVPSFLLGFCMYAVAPCPTS